MSRINPLSKIRREHPAAKDLHAAATVAVAKTTGSKVQKSHLDRITKAIAAISNGTITFLAHQEATKYLLSGRDGVLPKAAKPLDLKGQLLTFWMERPEIKDWREAWAALRAAPSVRPPDPQPAKVTFGSREPKCTVEKIGGNLLRIPVRHTCGHYELRLTRWGNDPSDKSRGYLAAGGPCSTCAPQGRPVSPRFASLEEAMENCAILNGDPSPVIREPQGQAPGGPAVAPPTVGGGSTVFPDTLLTKSMPQIIRRIVEARGDIEPFEAALKGQGEFSRRYANGSYMPFVIEVLPSGMCALGVPSVSISHTFEQNGDLMRDPEIVFAVLTLTGWMPYQITQDPVGRFRDALLGEYYERHQYPDIREVRDILPLANMWARNLKGQGWADKPRPVQSPASRLAGMFTVGAVLESMAENPAKPANIIDFPKPGTIEHMEKIVMPP